MPDWLKDSFHSNVNVSWGMLVLRLASAYLLGIVVALIYRYSRRPAPETPNFVTTLILLSVLIAMVTVIIGDSVARAFSLVGALAIVRFRTVVEDTRDTAFVILAVGVGMASGTGFIAAALIGLPFAAIAAVIFRPSRSESADFTLVVRIGLGHRVEELLRAPFHKHLTSSRLMSTATARQGAAYELTYVVRLRQPDEALALVAELNGIEGMQGVELRRS